MKARYFFAVAIIAIVTASFQMVAHQRQASSLVSTIVAKDNAGQDTISDQAALQSYVAAHMGVSAQIFLQASYNRANQQAQAAANPQSNGEVYAAAQAACASHADSIVQAHCVQDYVASHAAPSMNPQAVAPPPKADYTKRYVGPAWTFDSVGVALLVTLVAVSMGVYAVLLHWSRPRY